MTTNPQQRCYGGPHLEMLPWKLIHRQLYCYDMDDLQLNVFWPIN
jgi:hypothetical protein